MFPLEGPILRAECTKFIPHKTWLHNSDLSLVTGDTTGGYVFTLILNTGLYKLINIYYNVQGAGIKLLKNASLCVLNVNI